MTLYALAESRAIMKFYEALSSGNLTRVYESYQIYKDVVERARHESRKLESSIDSEYDSFMEKVKHHV
jgi:hypothetical protein